MKKILLIIMAVVLSMGGASLEAKTTSKKRSSNSSHSASAAKITERFDDGYPNIIGHTYSKTEEGVKMVLTFVNEDEATLKVSKGSQSQAYTTEWEYFGDGFLVVFSIDGSDEIVLYIGDEGRNLYLVDDYGDVMYDYGPMKLVK